MEAPPVGAIAVDHEQLPADQTPFGVLAGDSADNDPRIIIVAVTDTPADEWVVYETPPSDPDKTVADFEQNASYPRDDPVHEAAYYSDIERCDLSPQQAVESFAAGDLSSHDLQTYAFPAARISTAHIQPGGDEGDQLRMSA